MRCAPLRWKTFCACRTTQEKATYKKIPGRPGERLEEFLIGEAELPYTVVLKYNGITHYAISFNERAERPLPAVLSSQTATKLSDAEIATLINNPPKEEATAWESHSCLGSVDHPA